MRELNIFKKIKILIHFSVLLFLVIGCQKLPNYQFQKKPNILFAIADDQSFPYASAYGTTGVKTPAFDKVAKAGILFENAFVGAPQCSPSRAAILTGKNIWELEEAGTHASYFPKKFSVFTDLLENVGYNIGFTGKAWGPGNWKDAGWNQNPVGREFNSKSLEKVPASGIRLRDYFGNFVDFFSQKENEKPFFFWYGCHEPHRNYENGSGVNSGKDLSMVEVPSFLPNHELIQSDIADYTLEIEWFDLHLAKMIKFLEEKGELDNTIIVVTADNGMPFPSAKANLQEYGTHVPLAICWPKKISGNRVVEDLVALIDIAPTFLEIAKVNNPPQMSGKSLFNLLFSKDMDYRHRDYVLTGRERHTHARPDNLGYPARAIRTADYLYIRNFMPNSWPSGDPSPKRSKGYVKPIGFKSIEPGFNDIDNSPTKSFLIDQEKDYLKEYELAFSKRPFEQLYDIKRDPGCINNIAYELSYKMIKKELSSKLEELLKIQGDPRVLGYGDIFDSYPRISSMRDFSGFNERGEYNPEYLQLGQEKINK